MANFINLEHLPDTFNINRLSKLMHGKASKRMLNYAIVKLVKEKKLIKVKNGTYSKVGDVFYIANRVYGGYIGFSSALYLYGLKNELDAVVYVCTKSSEKKLKILDKIIEPINMSEQQYGTQIVDLSGKDILVSTYPKTIFDMLAKPKYANYFDMYRAMTIRPLSRIEWKEFLFYVKSANITTIRRAGYATEGIAPKWLTKKLNQLSKIGYRTSFFFKHKAKNYSSKWSIFDDLSMKSWYNGV